MSDTPRVFRLLQVVSLVVLVTASVGTDSNATVRAPGEAEKFAASAAPSFEETARPYLYFDSVERWRPLDVNRFLAERFPDGVGQKLCGQPHGKDCVKAVLAGLASLDFSHSWLEIHGSKRNGVDETAPPADRAGCRPHADCDDPRSSAIYVHEATHAVEIGWPGRYRFLDYWFFYRFNDARPVPVLPTNAFDHEGDWEGATVVTDAAAPNTVRWLQVAAHDAVWSYLPGVVRWQGTHPLLYVASGTHASYVRSCASACQQGVKRWDLLDLPEGRFDGHTEWALNDDLACERSACVRSFDDGSGRLAAAWPGHWGSTLRENFGRTARVVEAALNGALGVLRNNRFAALIAAGGAVSIKPLTDRSPCSAAYHERFQPAPLPRAGSSGGDVDRCRIGHAYSAADCKVWTGPFVVVSLCNPDQLRDALETGRPPDNPTFRLEVTSHRVDSLASAPGIWQVGGRPLEVGDVVRVVGPAPSGTTLTVRSSTLLGFREKTFDELQLERQTGGVASVTVTRDGGFHFEPGPAVVGGGAFGGPPPPSAPPPSGSLTPMTPRALSAMQVGVRVVVRFSSPTSRALVAWTKLPRRGVLGSTVRTVQPGQVVLPLVAPASASFVAVAVIGDSGLLSRSATARIRR